MNKPNFLRKNNIGLKFKSRNSAIMLLFFAPLVIGATIEQWRQREPRWVGHSAKPLDDLLGCLGSKYVGSLSAKMQAMPVDHGMSYTNIGANRDILVDVIDEGEQRTIKLWLRSFVGITAGAKEQIEKLSACT